MTVAWRVAGAVFGSLVVTWVASAVTHFHAAYVRLEETRSQYLALAASPLCTDSRQRLASIDVNRCTEALRHTESRTLSPFTLAFLETLQYASLCGPSEEHRCDRLVQNILQSSLQIAIVLLLLLVGAIYLLRQKWQIDSIVTSQLPLNCPNYPTHFPIYSRHIKDE